MEKLLRTSTRTIASMVAMAMQNQKRRCPSIRIRMIVAEHLPIARSRWSSSCSANANESRSINRCSGLYCPVHTKVGTEIDNWWFNNDDSTLGAIDELYNTKNDRTNGQLIRTSATLSYAGRRWTAPNTLERFLNPIRWQQHPPKNHNAIQTEKDIRQLDAWMKQLRRRKRCLEPSSL